MAITTNEISIPKKLFGTRADKDLEFDSSIPEFCPDIARLIRVDCTPFSESCELDDSKAVIKGKVVYDLLYETDYKSRLRCCSFTQDFSQTIQLPRNNHESVSAFCRVDCERINCKLLSPRRFVIKATLGTSIDAEGCIPVKAVAVGNSEETFFRSKSLNYRGEKKRFSETFRFKDSFPLTQSEKSIGEIICGNVYLQQPQVTLSDGKAEIKSVASVHALCEEENNEGSYYVSVKTLPISIDFENETIDDTKKVFVSLSPSSSEISHELDQYGESRVINCEFSTLMQLDVSGEEEVTVADDVFEKGFDGTPVFSTATFPKILTESDVGFSEEVKIEPTVPTVGSILDTTVECKNGVSEITENGIRSSGIFTATLTYESDGRIYSIDKSIPFERMLSLDIQNGKTVDTVTHPIEIQSQLHPDGSVSLRVVASSHVTVFAESEETFVSDVTKRTVCDESIDDGTLVFCFPKKNESLWEIAKRYKTNPQDILASNQGSFDEEERAKGNGGPILIKG